MPNPSQQDSTRIAVHPRHVALFTAATFLGAALLFLVQPMMGRALLPHMGGAPFVWVICLAFFQAGLFLGYLWVHLSARLPARIRLAAPLSLALLALAIAPLDLNAAPAHDLPPALSLLLYLAAVAGLPYLTLATTTPLLQLDYAERFGAPPYHLYAISNAGSLLGLLLYPFVIEPRLDLVAQRHAFTLGFGTYATLLLLVALAGAARSGAASPAAGHITARQRLTWMALAAAPAALLNAISNHVTIDVAASPLLWVLMLALYLMTFMAAFAGERFHLAEPYRALWIACSVALPVMLLPGNQVPLALMVGVPAVTLWTGAMLCHGELARRSPPPAQLTAFYLWLSAGGALGGGFVAFLAPLVFDAHYELPIAMLAIHLVLAVVSRRRDPRIAPTGAQRLTWLGAGLAVPLLLGTLYAQASAMGQPGEVLERSRSFFGPLEVTRTATSIVLTHGRTHHGKQLRDPALRDTPVAYFGPDSGAGRALRLHRRSQSRTLGVLGLGVGTLAAYTTERDHMVFYEIDPEVTRLARAHFSYLSRARGEVRVEHGDGRLLLASAPTRAFDVLLLDAFSSDSVPTHLLTHEAFGTYLRALAQGGVLAANVSNRHLAVERVVVGSARHHGLAVVVIESPADRARGLSRARWALMARTREVLAPLLEGDPKRLEVTQLVDWTDRASSLLSIIP